jgi:hypothetical protein
MLLRIMYMAGSGASAADSLLHSPATSQNYRLSLAPRPLPLSHPPPAPLIPPPAEPYSQCATAAAAPEWRLGREGPAAPNPAAGWSRPKTAPRAARSLQ